MTAVNGVHPADRSDVIQSQLGKRKRSSSPKLEVDNKDATHDGLAQEFLTNVLQIIQDVAGKQLLDYPLPSSIVKDGPATKRRRTQSTNHATETIGNRIGAHAYQTLAQLTKDLDEVKVSIESQVNGHADAEPLNSSDVDKIRDLIEKEYSRQLHPADAMGPDHGRRPALQLLSLRGQTDGGVRQLFTGLPKHDAADTKDADTRLLPNGFELIDSALMNAEITKSKDSRTFGDVFTPYRSVKSLDPPRQLRNQESQLNFIPMLSKLGSQDKQEYRNTELGTGTWLSYATTEMKEPTETNLQSKRLANTASSLFRAAYSSFAPSVDHTTSVITESDRALRWFKSNAVRLPFEENAVEQSQTNGGTEEDIQIELAEDFDEIVQNYISEADMDAQDEGEKLLCDISDLIQTLSSYQTIRDLDQNRKPGSSTTVSQPEIDTYELLRTQLQLVINMLPPHTVAKLDGDQMAALNIKTTMLYTPPEIAGTAQADDYTLRKQRGAQPASNLVGRTSAAPVRPTYGTPNASHNSQIPAYAPNNPAASSYGTRQPATMYNTPRTNMPAQGPPYAQQPFRMAHAAYTTPAGQQYSQASGAKYNQAYVPRPSQPGYQQRAQDRTSTWQQSDTPQKPLANGQTPQQYSARPFVAQGQGFSNSPAQSTSMMQQKLLEQMKHQQSVSTPETAI